MGSTQKSETLAKAEHLINSVGLPSHPKIILDLNREINKPNADMRAIADLVSKDIAMSGRAIKIASSPFYGSKTIESIDQALFCLGLKTFYSTILSAALEDSLNRYSQGDNKLVMKLHQHSQIAAMTSSYIANKTCKPLSDMAYMVGLFHDCAIPTMQKKYPDYASLMDEAMCTVPAETERKACDAIIELEDNQYSTNHCVVGGLMAKSWTLPAPVCEAISSHHSRDIDAQKDTDARRLNAVILLAELICQDFDPSGIRGKEDIGRTVDLYGKALSALNLDRDDLLDLREDVFGILSNL